MQILLWVFLGASLAQAGEDIVDRLASGDLASIVEPFGVPGMDRFDDDEDEDEDDYLGENGEDEDAEVSGEPVEDEFTHIVGAPEELEFVLISAGSFSMGAPKSDNLADDDERPRHTVRISDAFYLGKYPVTQAVWERVMGKNPSHFLGRSRPVEGVSWDDIQEFLEKLNQSGEYGLCRLPTEAEWEYAARAGSSTRYFFSNDATDLGKYAWYEENSSGRTHPVGSRAPNDWGLYDMFGNVWEWVQDFYEGDYYADSDEVNPRGPAQGEERVARGCSWSNEEPYCRSSYRAMDDANARDTVTGFRLVCSSPR